MDDKHVLVGLQGDIVLQDAVLRDADTDQARTNCAYASNDNRAFEAGYNPGYDWTGGKNRSESRYEKETDPNSKPQNPPQNAPTLPQYIIRSPAV